MGLLKEELEAGEAEGIARAYRTGPDSCPQDCSSCLSFVTIHLGYRTNVFGSKEELSLPLLKSGEPCFDCICHFCLVSIDIFLFSANIISTVRESNHHIIILDRSATTKVTETTAIRAYMHAYAAPGMPVWLAIRVKAFGLNRPSGSPDKVCLLVSSSRGSSASRQSAASKRLREGSSPRARSLPQPWAAWGATSMVDTRNILACRGVRYR